MQSVFPVKGFDGMRAKLFRVNTARQRDVFELCCADGTKKRLSQRDLIEFFRRFRDEGYLENGRDGRWDNIALDLSELDGDVIAYVVERPRNRTELRLVIVDPDPFASLFMSTDDPDLISISEYARMHGVTRETVKVYCRNGRIPGAMKAGGNWVVPRDAMYPTDRRRRMK